ncbi:hypothetical protein [Bacillus cereus]|uniref:hypothetical protein n=1 Tax=Bacillus cereus TaxID=1396 RepID=UPI003D019B4F
MARKKQPKYNVGDIVVITLYGTVGKITNVNFLFLLGGYMHSFLIHILRGETNGVSCNILTFIEKRRTIEHR